MNKPIRYTLIAFLSILAAAPLSANVSREDLIEIRNLTNEGNYEQALEKHIWFHDASRGTSFGAVRLSYALRDWAMLGKKYSPALQALIDIRNQNSATLDEGKGNFENFQELSSINEYLGDTENTYDMFVFLDGEYPQQAKQYFHVVFDLLVAKERFDLCSKYLGDPIYEYEKLRNSRELDLKNHRENPDRGLDDYADKRFLGEVVKLLHLLIAIDRIEEANEIRKRALEYFDHGEIRQIVIS